MKEDQRPRSPRTVRRPIRRRSRTCPPAPRKTLATIKDTLEQARLRGAARRSSPTNIVWSLGGGTGADVAMATWQADPGSFDAMAAAIAGGCGADGDKKVACPAGPPKRGVYQLVLEPRGSS